ncbi:MAG: glycerophosphodiester phosphodiesterase family protein [Solirubrobacteraceae bacterium]
MSLVRVGHKGADAIVPGNTPASFDAALAAGVQMIEFDVLSERYDGSGALLVAHDYQHVRGAPTLAEALAHLAGRRFAELCFDVDLKLPGYELRVLEALDAAGLTERCLISSMHTASLARIRAADPAVRLGWSVPRLRKDYTTDLLTRVPALALAIGYRRALPGRAARMIAGGRCDALMSHWRLVTPRLVRAVRQAGGELYVWTVDEAPQIRQLERLGVSGVITNDPRLFH